MSRFILWIKLRTPFLQRKHFSYLKNNKETKLSPHTPPPKYNLNIPKQALTGVQPSSLICVLLMTRLMPQWIAELSDCDRNHVGPQVEKSLDLYGESMTASNGVDLGGSEPVKELEKF